MCNSQLRSRAADPDPIIEKNGYGFDLRENEEKKELDEIFEKTGSSSRNKPDSDPI